jgi:hypothetical protein
MRTFDNLIGNTEAYVNGVDVGGPFRRLKKVARTGTRLAKRGTKLAVLTANPHAMTMKAAKLTGKVVAAATGPIRKRIFRAFFGKLTGRRARGLSWQRRRSLNPSAGERQEAQRWATGYVKRKGVLGKLVGAALGGEATIGEPATAAVITASIPLLIQLARKALKKAEGEGAPADPRGGGEGQSESPREQESEASAGE